jgi:hypothetical protein
MGLVRRTQTVTALGQESPPMELPRPTPALHILNAILSATGLAILVAVAFVLRGLVSDTPELVTVITFAIIPLALGLVGMLAYIAVWFALQTMPYVHALRELLAGRDLDNSGEVGDVPERDHTEGLVNYLQGAINQRYGQTVDSKNEQYHNDADLLEFTRKTLEGGDSPAKNWWTGGEGKRRLPSKRNFGHTEWRTLLIQPQIDAGNMTIRTGKDGREWPEWTIDGWVEAVKRLADAGYLPTIKNRLTVATERTR